MAHLGDEISHGEGSEDRKCYCFSYLQIRLDNFVYPPEHPGDKLTCCFIPGAKPGAVCTALRIRQHIGCIDSIHVPAITNGLKKESGDVLSYGDCKRNWRPVRDPSVPHSWDLGAPFGPIPADTVAYITVIYTQLDLCGECDEPTPWDPTPCPTYFPTDLFASSVDSDPFITTGWSYDSTADGHGGSFGPECFPPIGSVNHNPGVQLIGMGDLPPRPNPLPLIPLVSNSTSQQDEDTTKKLLDHAEHSGFITKDVCNRINRIRFKPHSGLCNIHRNGVITRRGSLPGFQDL